MQLSLIILRGLPGSGKSTLAKLISEEGKYPVYSIDDYFTNEKGEYDFKFDQNHLAYKACESNVMHAMKNALPKIILDNVFSLEWEMEPYFKLAAEHNYAVHVVTVENRHGHKNVHAISDEQVKKMAAKFSVKLI